MTIGSELRQAREERGVSLKTIAERTKIRQSVLRAIENDDFRHAPGGVIMRGFLKLYAREVGLDPDDIATRYVAMLEVGGGAAATPRTTSSGLSVARVTIVLAVIALVVGGYFLWRRTSSGGRELPPSPAPVTATSAPASAPPASGTPPTTSVPAQPSSSPATPVSVPPGEVRVDLLVTGACWIAARADGQQVAYRTMQPGERLTISAKQQAVLRIGMPANVSVSINGTPMPPFARPATPTTLTVTPEDYQRLLSR